MKRWRNISLTKRIIGHVALLEIVTLIIGIMAIWYAVGFQKTINDLVGKNIKTLQAAREMENALANQKGFVTYYFLDGDSKWLQELSHYREVFRNWLETAKQADHDPAHAAMLAKITRQYQTYIQNKDRVIEMYQSGERKKGEKLHWQVRSQFFDLNKTCQAYEHVNEEEIQRLRETARSQAAEMGSFVVIALIVSVVLGVFLAFLLVVQVIGPIRRMAEMAPQPEDTERCKPDESVNEVAKLGGRVRSMIADIDQARNELEQSQQMLMHSEKMALVGKLATEVSHTIRSPMTSINMRLFSLQRNLDLTENQEEDFAVVSEEMRRLDNIVRNFLEFSRPPKLHKQLVNVSRVIDLTVELLEYRLKRHDVELIRDRPDALPLVEADPELMKEVFVNLIVNACEAMGEGGRIFIEETESVADWGAPAVRVELRDTGPGIPEEAQQEILEPFHTTKTHGTGLGLFISARIIREHGGQLDLHSAEDRGATFIIVLPVAENQNE